jgi:hypothetical protein
MDFPLQNSSLWICESSDWYSLSSLVLGVAKEIAFITWSGEGDHFLSLWATNEIESVSSKLSFKDL